MGSFIPLGRTVRLISSYIPISLNVMFNDQVLNLDGLPTTTLLIVALLWRTQQVGK